jgi:hypothetical protein
VTTVATLRAWNSELERKKGGADRRLGTAVRQGPLKLVLVILALNAEGARDTVWFGEIG